jgi:hypothetical protein
VAYSLGRPAGVSADNITIGQISGTI